MVAWLQPGYFIPFLSQTHLPRCQHPMGGDSRTPENGNATPSSGHRGKHWGQGQEQPRSGWDGKRSRKSRIWEESSTAWVVSGEGKAPNPLYKYSQANTRREQNISTGRKSSGKTKDPAWNGLSQDPGPNCFTWGHLSHVPAPAEGTPCKERGALTSLGRGLGAAPAWNYRESP